jgi:uncharacterized protein YutE (UPF0331/DUF86 family)
MNDDQKIIAHKALKQALDSISLIEASLSAYIPYDPKRKYTPKEQEPFDALCDRFIRAVEICLKFFRSYEKLLEGVNSETIRDLLNKMEKFKIIESTALWLEMRDVRNRIVHDYMPDDIERIYSSIAGAFGKELLKVKEEVTNLKLE